MGRLHTDAAHAGQREEPCNDVWQERRTYVKEGAERVGSGNPGCASVRKRAPRRYALVKGNHQKPKRWKSGA
jgi:hypothetical protein